MVFGESGFKRDDSSTNSMMREMTGVRAELDDMRSELAAVREQLVHLTSAVASIDPATTVDRARERANPPRYSVSVPAISRLRTLAPTWANRRWGGFVVQSVSPEAAIPLGRQWEIVALTVVMVSALLLRFTNLSTVPLGIQGDEANTGLEGLRVLDVGWIGSYTPSAAGNPTGFYYLEAASIWFFGPDMFAVRVVPALLGLLTVLALYVVLRRNMGAHTAVAGSALLAASGWHIIFSRIAFPTVFWPLLVVIFAGAACEAIRRDSWRWWACAGGLTALGLYAYNGHVLFLGVVALFVTCVLFGGWGVTAAAVVGVLLWSGPLSLAVAPVAALALWLWRPSGLKRRFAHATAFGIAFCIFVFPLASYAADSDNGYFGRGRGLSIFNSTEWRSQSASHERIQYVAQRYGDFYDRLCCDLSFDSVDTTGVAPLVPVQAFVLALIGVAFAIWRRRGPLTTFGLMVLVLAPFGSITTIDFVMRRSLVVVPFLSMFAGLAIVELVWLALRLDRIQRGVALLIITFVFGSALYQNIDDYFHSTLPSPLTHWVMATDMVEASEYMATLDDDDYVYFYAERWTINYEIRRYLAPDVQGVDRSTQFGEFGFDVEPARGSPVFIFVGSYRKNADIVERLYPGGQYVYGRTLPHGNGQPSFIAYVTDPPGSPATPLSPGATPSATPGATPVSSLLPK